jgi:hypothetical protein
MLRFMPIRLSSIPAPAVLALLVAIGPGAAQQPQTAPAAPSPEAMLPPGADPDITNTNPAAPVAGANSFTRAQVRRRLEANGYTDVDSLSKDKHGIWRGQAAKAGKRLAVSVDYQGNITAK